MESRGVRVRALDEVTVYALSYLPYSSDGYLALPCDTFGTEYLVVSYDEGNALTGRTSSFGLVAAEDGTTVTVTLPVTVGTHALRVTQESYRDYVRFVRIEFEQQTEIDIELDPVPVASRRMNLAKRVRVLRDRELPWHRRWWALAGFGVGIAAATTVIVALIPRGVDADREVAVSRP